MDFESLLIPLTPQNNCLFKCDSSFSPPWISLKDASALEIIGLKAEILRCRYFQRSGIITDCLFSTEENCRKGEIRSLTLQVREIRSPDWLHSV